MDPQEVSAPVITGLDPKPRGLHLFILLSFTGSLSQHGGSGQVRLTSNAILSGQGGNPPSKVAILTPCPPRRILEAKMMLLTGDFNGQLGPDLFTFVIVFVLTGNGMSSLKQNNMMSSRHHLATLIPHWSPKGVSKRRTEIPWSSPLAKANHKFKHGSVFSSHLSRRQNIPLSEHSLPVQILRLGVRVWKYFFC